MKNCILALCAVALVWTASISPSRADTYDISAGSNGTTVGGYIVTTDGANNTVYPFQITDYDITIGSSQIAPGNNTATVLTGTILWENNNILYLDFSSTGTLGASLAAISRSGASVALSRIVPSHPQ